MRILHLLASPFWSGPMENVALLALAQRSLGHEVSVAIDRRRTEASAEEIAAPRLKANGLLDEGGLSLCSKDGLGELWRDSCLLRQRALDVVHAHFTHDHFVARLGRPRGARLVRSIHAPRSIRWSLPRADAYTVPAESEATRLMGRRVGVMPPLLDSGFSPPSSKEAIRAELGLGGAPVVGMVSTFQASRRHDVGVAAFGALWKLAPAARLVLVGDGATQQAVRDQVIAAGLAQICTFAGYQSGDAFVRWLQALDVVWILGLGNDWSGRAAVQARACNVRVIAVDEGGLAQHADELVTLDPDDIAAATLRVEPALGMSLSNEDIARRVLGLYVPRPLIPGGEDE